MSISTLGEGYGADELVRLMNRNGITNYRYRSAARSLHAASTAGQTRRVAIQKPTDRENAVQALVDLHGYGISTAGSYRNYFEQNGQRYSHVIDPTTGRPINHRLVSATVIAPTALEADGWDTGLMVLGTEKALKLAEEKGLAVYLISKTDDGFSAVMTPQFKAFWCSEIKSPARNGRAGCMRPQAPRRSLGQRDDAEGQTGHCRRAAGDRARGFPVILSGALHAGVGVHQTPLVIVDRNAGRIGGASGQHGRQ